MRRFSICHIQTEGCWFTASVFFSSALKPENCPQFESPKPLLIPVGSAIPISFHGKNLDIYDVRSVEPAPQTAD